MKISPTYYRLTLTLSILCILIFTQNLLAQEKLRVIIATDIGGDPDDEQSMVRFLTYANEWDIEGIIATRSTGTEENKNYPELNGLQIMDKFLDAYEEVYPKLSQHDDYPTRVALQQVTVAGYGGEGGVDLIINALQKDDPRPVWYSNWGTPREQSQLDKAPDKIRRTQGASALNTAIAKLRLSTFRLALRESDYENANFPIYVDAIAGEAPCMTPVDSTGRWYHRIGPILNEVDGWNLEEDVRTGHGPLGALYPTNVAITFPENNCQWGPYPMKEGDSGFFLYLILTGMNDPERPNWGSWGGRFNLRPGTNYQWIGEPDTYENTTSTDNTLKRWASAITMDFKARMDWCVKDYEDANHPPEPQLNGDLNKAIQNITASPREKIKLNAEGSNDPDGDDLAYNWIYYQEAGSYAGDITINNATSAKADFIVPKVTKDETIHIVLEVTDEGSPALTSYRRIVVTAL